MEKMPKAIRHNHQRSQSWPPFKIHVVRSRQPKQEIDEDPFAFFISKPEDLESSWNENLSAGIEDVHRTQPLSPFFTRRNKEANFANPSNKARPLSSSRSLSPLCTRRPKDASLVDPSPTPKPTKLKTWILKLERRCRYNRRANHIAVPENSPATPRPNSPASPSQIRGRGNVRGSPRTLASRNRGTRSHSERPRAWREPGEGIWTVSEEQEEVGLGIFL